MPLGPGVDGKGEQLPERLGRFEVLGRLGEGGMGQVLRARDPRLDREVAIKVLRAELDDGRAPLAAELARRRLVREAQAMARLDHPNVIGVHEVGEDGERVFLVMERVAGTTLRGWMAAAPRSWREVLALFAQIGAGLAAAHDAGLVHRDVKPDNMLIGDDGRARITDFGLVGVEVPADARGAEPATVALTHEGAMVGTPGYMAPEQLRGQAADPRSDQFGLCVSLYETLYGSPPFAGDSFRELANASLDGVIRAAPADTDVPEAVRAVVVRGLAVDPAARWPDVRALLDALAAAAAPPLAAAPRRRPIVIAAIAALVIIVGAVGSIAVWRMTRAPAATPATRPPEPPAASLPLPPSAVVTEVASGGCDGSPVFVDDDTLVYRHGDRAGVDLRVRSLATGHDRALTNTPDIDEMFPQPALGERAIVALPRVSGSGGAGAARFDLDTGERRDLPAGAGIFFNPGAITAGGAIYYVLGGGTQLIELRNRVARELASFPGAYIFTLTIDRDVRTAALGVSGVGICLVDLRAPAPPRCLKLAEVALGEPAFDAEGRVYYGAISGIRRHDPATGEDVLVLRDQGVTGGMATSPSGTVLAWSDCQPQIEITRLADNAVVHAESLTGASSNKLGGWAFVRETPTASLVSYRGPGGVVHLLTRADQGLPGPPALDPDSDAIVFSMSDPSPGFYLAHGQSHKPIRKLSADTGLQQPVWVDARRVAVTKLHDDGEPYVYLVDTDTGEARQALTAPRQTVDRQPDGPTLLLANDDRTRLFLWDPAAGGEREIAIPAQLAGRPFLGAALTAGARAVDLRIGEKVWQIASDGSAPPRLVFAPPPGRGFWGIEVDHEDRLHVLLSEDRGAIYRVALPR